MKKVAIFVILVIGLWLVGCGEKTTPVEPPTEPVTGGEVKTEVQAPAEPEPTTEPVVQPPAEEPETVPEEVAEPEPTPDEEAKSDVAATVEIINVKFIPSTVTIKAGETVRWIHKDSEKMRHLVQIYQAKIRSDFMNVGDTFEYTFEEPGEYDVRNPTPAFINTMQGKVIVE